MFLNNEDGMAETLRTLIILRAIYKKETDN
jgi:hypothetical protein